MINPTFSNIQNTTPEEIKNEILAKLDQQSN